MWTIVIVFAIAGAVIAFFAVNIMIILGTSLAGSYLCLSGIGYFAGGFPSVVDIQQMIQKHSAPSWQIYCYLGGMLVLAILGMVVQCKYLTRKKDDEDTTAYKSAP